MKPVLVIGAGITGITAAYELSKHGRKVLLVERDKKLGGILRSIKPKNTWLEEYYHCLFQGKEETENFYGLARELGLFHKIVWKTGSTGFYYHDKMYRLSSPIDLVKYKPLTLIDKFTLAKLLIKIKLMKNPLHFDGMSAREWVVENSNEAIYDKFFGPLIKSKFGKDENNVSAAWLLVRLIIRNKGRITGEKLGYLQGGFQQAIEKMAEKIRKNGKILLNKSVKNTEVRNNRITRVFLSDDQKIEVDHVISTVSPFELEKVVKLPKSYVDKISVPYVSVICPMLCLKKPLTGKYWWTNIIRKDICFGAVVEHTVLQSPRLYGGHIVYLPSYYAGTDVPMWKLSDKRVFEKFFKDLQKIFPHIEKGDVLWYHIARDRAGGVNFRKGVYTRINRTGITTPIENLFVGGTFNTPNEARINSSVGKGKECAHFVLNG